MRVMTAGKYIHISISIAVLFICSAFHLAYASEALDRAYKAGTITSETYVVQKLKSYFTPERVNPALQRMFPSPNRKPTRNMTHLLKYARLHFDSFSEESQAYIKQYFARPTDQNNEDFNGYWYLPDPISYWVPPEVDYPQIGEKFKFWYVDHDTPDAEGYVHTTTLDYVKSVARVLDTVYNVEISSMGYQEPPDDSNKDDNGGDGKYDVYIMDCGAVGLYGYVDPPGKADPSATTGDEANSYYSFMVLDNDYSSTDFPNSDPNEALKVTAAHEYHHAIQFGINVDSSPWYMEATSTWMEDQVYDEINDNRQYLTDFFNSPEVSLDYEGDDYHYYGTWIWNEFLETKWGQSTIKLIWDELDPYGSNRAIDAITTVLIPKGSTLESAFTEFVAMNYAKTGFYKDASETGYSEVTIANSGSIHQLDPNSTVSEQITNINHLASKYYKFVPNSTVTSALTLRITVDGEDSKNVSAVAISKSKNNSFQEYYFSLNSTTKQGRVDISDFSYATTSEVVLALVNYSMTSLNNNLEIKYSAALRQSFPEEESDVEEEATGCFIMSTYF
ncbi:MAG: MXAN_6640 family putative metalloprotease [bacterium]